MPKNHPASNDAAAYREIEKAVQDGKVRSAGVFCYYIQETDRFLPKVGVKPALIQNEIHPYYQDSRIVVNLAEGHFRAYVYFPLTDSLFLPVKRLRYLYAEVGETIEETVRREVTDHFKNRKEALYL